MYVTNISGILRTNINCCIYRVSIAYLLELQVCRLCHQLHPFRHWFIKVLTAANSPDYTISQTCFQVLCHIKYHFGMSNVAKYGKKDEMTSR